MPLKLETGQLDRGGTLFDVVGNVEAGEAGAGGEMREDPDHDMNAAETPRDGGRESVEDAEQKMTSTDAPRTTIGKLADYRAVAMDFAEDDFSPVVVQARRKLANATAMHLIAESDVN